MRILTVLGVTDQFGSSSHELQTAAEPYGWTLLLDNAIAADEENDARELMTADSCVILGCIENLGYVTWRYETPDGTQEYTVSAEDATAFAGFDIKTCAESVTALQRLVNRLGFERIGIRETLQETGTFYLDITNTCSTPLSGLTIDYYLGDEQLGTRTVENADGSLLRRGDTFTFDFVPEDFPAGTAAAALESFRFALSVTEQDGDVTLLSGSVPVSAQYAWHYFFTLADDANAGFVLHAG